MTVKTDFIEEVTPDAGVTIDGLLIKDGALPALPGAEITSDQVAALAGYEAALVGAETGEALLKTAGGVEFGAVTSGPSLSDYANVIVVDAGGNGDYTTLEAAVAAANNNDVIYVFGNLTENPFTVNKTLTIIAPVSGVTVPTTITLNTGILTLVGGAYTDIVIAAGTLNLRGNVRVTTVTMPSGTLDMFSSHVGVITTSTTRTIRAIACRLDELNITGLTGSSYLQSCRIGLNAFIDNGSGVPSTNAPLFSCSLQSEYYDFTPAPGNYSNIANGVTWPAIP